MYSTQEACLLLIAWHQQNPLVYLSAGTAVLSADIDAVSKYLLNSTVQGDISVLLVHVVVASTRLIPHPDTKVLDLGGVLLCDLQRGLPLMNTYHCVCPDLTWL